MCQYIKDDGEECGMDDEPFCHHHEDTTQALRWEQENAGHEKCETDESGRSDDSSVEADPTVCDDCGMAVRPTVTALGEAAYQPKMVTVEWGFACECTTVPREATNIPKSRCPEGWFE